MPRAGERRGRQPRTAHRRDPRAVPRGEKAPSIRIRDLSGAAGSLRSGYPIHFAIVGPDRARAQTLAGQLVTRLSQDRHLTDLWIGPRLVSVPSMDIDRARAAAMGVSPAEMSASIQPVFGPAPTGSLKCFRLTWPIWVEVNSGRGIDIDTFERLKVRNDKGAMVPVRSIATLRQDRAPDRLERIDLLPAVSITASLAEGLSLAEARFVCEHLAEEVLPKDSPSEYRLTWLRAMPAARHRPGRSRPGLTACPPGPKLVSGGRNWCRPELVLARNWCPAKLVSVHFSAEKRTDTNYPQRKNELTPIIDTNYSFFSGKTN